MKRPLEKEYNMKTKFVDTCWLIDNDLHIDQLEAERKELTEALKSLMEGVDNLPPLTAIQGVLKKEYEKAEIALSKSK